MMQLPLELAKWQTGYIVILIMAGCFFVIAMFQTLASGKSKHCTVFGYGLILMCVGIISTLLDFNIVKISLESFGGGLLAQSMAFTFAAIGVVVAFYIIIGALYFAKKLQILDTQSVLSILLTVTPIVAVMALVIKFINVGAHSESVALLRETIFMLIPLLTLISYLFCVLARKIVTR